MARRIVGLVQARMGSSRLPGKALALIEQRPMTWHILDRLRQAPGLAGVVLATAESSENEPLRRLAAQLQVPCVSGPEEDLVTRLLGAADACAADAIVRITGDCPLVDPGVVGQVVQAYRDHAAATDYVCNIWPRSFPHGLDTEIYPRETLRRLEVEVPRGAARETFARYVWEHAPEFRLLNVASARPLAHWRWTVDYPEDLAFVRAVYRRLYRPERPFLMADVLRLLAEEPALANLNAGRLGDTEAAAAQSAVRPLLGTAP